MALLETFSDNNSIITNNISNINWDYSSFILFVLIISSISLIVGIVWLIISLDSLIKSKREYYNNILSRRKINDK